MSKSKFKGNFSAEELAELEAERLERLEELKAKKDKDKKRRDARINRHLDWSEATEE